MRNRVDNTPTRVLYDSTTGSNSVTLPESASNFKFLIVSLDFTGTLMDFLNVIVVPGYRNSYVDLNYYPEINGYGIYGPVTLKDDVVSCTNMQAKTWSIPKIYRIIGIR